jgi:adenylate kinase
MNLVILGEPGSGKGTQAKLLAEKLSLAHISSGDLLREFAQGDSPKAKIVADLLKTGQLLPFEMVLEVCEPKLKESKSGFVLDGVPRNRSQAEYMDSFFKENGLTLDLVIYLTLTDEEALKRLLKRAQLEDRSDDNEMVIRERLKVFHEATQPIIEYYRQQGKLLEIDGLPPIEPIHQDIISKLAEKFPQQ